MQTQTASLLFLFLNELLQFSLRNPFGQIDKKKFFHFHYYVIQVRPRIVGC